MSETTGRALSPVGQITQDLVARSNHFEQALVGTGIPAKRFIRVVLTAVNLNPDLLNCDRRSLVNAALKAANDGLVPDGRDGALVPFDGKVTWIPMIAGVRKKVRRTGEITSWDVTAVFAKDTFDFELGDDPFIKHKPWMPPELPRVEDESDQDYAARLRRHIDRGPMTFVYSIAKLKGGDLSRDVMTRAEVELVRDTYARKNKKGEFSQMWRKSFPEAAKKTVGHRHAKQLPMSSDVLALLSRDSELYDMERERGERVQAPRELSDRLDFLAGVEPEPDPIQELAEGESTPPFRDAAPDDTNGVGTVGEGAAVQSPSEALSPGVGPDEPPHTSGPAPSGAAAPAVPGGPRKQQAKPQEADLLSQATAAQAQQPAAPTIPLEQRGEAQALKGRAALDRWINELPADEMARVSLAQLKAWRIVADKVAA